MSIFKTCQYTSKLREFLLYLKIWIYLFTGHYYKDINNKVMSFAGLKYDLCEQKQYVKETIGPGKYKINQPLICGTCFQNNPSIIVQKTGVSMSSKSPWRFYSGPVDVESELKNLTRIASRCPTKKYLPNWRMCDNKYQGQPSGAGISALSDKLINSKINNKMCGDKDLIDFPDCYFPVEHTRLNSCPSRGIGLNRFEFPCKDPQANIIFPGALQISSRLVIKDNYRPCKVTPKINNMNPCAYSDFIGLQKRNNCSNKI